MQSDNKDKIRHKICKRRQGLGYADLEEAASGLAKQGKHCLALFKAKRILTYAPFAGEISPGKLLNTLPYSQLFLPRIVNYANSTMEFYSANGLAAANRYGIFEPSQGDPVDATELDVFFIPLVAFDAHGNRLGMGAGFYDRALAHVKHDCATRPLLIGMAHAFQQVERLPVESWDIPLDAILTDDSFIPIKAGLT